MLIIAIATYCSRRPEGLDFRDLVRLVLMAAVPILLVFKQPDLGTAIVMTVILMVMLAVAGMPGRYLLLLIVGAVLLVLFAHQRGPPPALPDRAADQLHLTQRRQPDVPPTTCTQAKEAIAHGGVFGQGLFHGALTNLAYVPSQQTDFIFSAVGEQLGFVGGRRPAPALRGGGLAGAADGPAGPGHLRPAAVRRAFRPARLLVFENVGMNMGIMPVAGIPLPFLSYGGSAMIGVLRRHRHRHQRALRSVR